MFWNFIIDLSFHFLAKNKHKDRIDQDHENKIQQLKQQIQDEKDEIAKLENYKKAQSSEYEMNMKELNKIDSEFRSLRDQKLQQKVIPKPTEDDFEKEEEANAVIQKNKVLYRIAENKVTQLKVRIATQKRK